MKFNTYKIFFFISVITVLLFSCIKEYSYETGKNILGKSEGTLKDSLGDCRGIVIAGTYKVDTALTTNNYLVVNINVVKAGQYKIYSDTVNGFWFWDSGYVAAGTTTLKIKGYGKPIFEVATNFQLVYNNSFCLFTVPITTTIPAAIYRDYFPTTIGSNWQYDVAGSTDSLHIESSNVDTVIGSNTYHIFNGKHGLVTNKGYYYKDGLGNYYRYDTLELNSGRLPLIFLKDNQPLLTQWDSPISTATIPPGVTGEVKMHFTLLGVNISRTVNGNTFDSVMYVKGEMQYKLLGTFQTVQNFHTYYAKNVGLIEWDAPGIYTWTIRRWKVY